MTWSAAEIALLTEMDRAVRGPKREGCFALWLTVRVAEEIGRSSLADRVQRRRVVALERRLSSLVLPAPLRRALTAALATLKEITPDSAALALNQLAAPARDTVGPEAGKALLDASRGVPDLAHEFD